MPATRTKPKVPTEVLTLTEAAAYLRTAEDVLRRMAEEQLVPARKVGEEWRFLKTAIRDWLRGTPGPDRPGGFRPGSKEAILQVAGIWKDDPTVDEMLEEIYRQRGRPMIQEGV